MAKKAPKKPHKFLRRFLVLCLLAVAVPFLINGWVVASTASRILSAEEAAALADVDCILVLGCSVRADGSPSAMLAERLQTGVALYEAGAAPKLLMSGDNGTVQYNEVAAMSRYALDKGVPAHDIFLDYAGFSTYESAYRASAIFQAKKIIIVTQKYHLYRALYIAKAMGLEAYGVSCDTRTYAGQFNREVREILARNKDFLLSIFKPKPTYLGDPVPVSGPGNLSAQPSPTTFLRFRRLLQQKLSGW